MRPRILIIVLFYRLLTRLWLVFTRDLAFSFSLYYFFMLGLSSSYLLRATATYKVSTLSTLKIGSLVVKGPVRPFSINSILWAQGWGTLVSRSSSSFLFLNRTFWVPNRLKRLLTILRLKPTLRYGYLLKYTDTRLLPLQGNSQSSTLRSPRGYFSFFKLFNKGAEAVNFFIPRRGKKTSIIYTDYNKKMFNKTLVHKHLLWHVITKKRITKRRYLPLASQLVKNPMFTRDVCNILFYILRGACLCTTQRQFRVILQLSQLSISSASRISRTALIAGDVISLGYSLLDIKRYTQLLQVKIPVSSGMSTKRFWKRGLPLTAYHRVFYRIASKLPVFNARPNLYYTVDYKLGVILILRDMDTRSLPLLKQLHTNSHLRLSYWRYNV